MTEKELRNKILEDVKKYHDQFLTKNRAFSAGDRVFYGGRVFDSEEVTALADSASDFWLTTGRYAERFEKEFAEFLGVKYCSLTSSGSSANLLAFMALTSPKLGDRAVACDSCRHRAKYHDGGQSKIY